MDTSSSVVANASFSYSSLIDLVRTGYKTAVMPYHEQKDTSILFLHIYHHWLSLIPDGRVAELGCGSGYPLAHHIASVWKGTAKQYIGVDLSEEQIDIAKRSLLNESETVSFTVREMMDWCKKEKDKSLSGIISLFSIFHVPRSQQVELFTQIERILHDSAPILFTVPEKAVEGFEDRWLGVSKMYWSSFSHSWYEITLEDLGFEFVSKSKEVKGWETTYYLLFRKRPKKKVIVDPRETFQNSVLKSRLQQQMNTSMTSLSPQTPLASSNQDLLTPLTPQMVFSSSTDSFSMLSSSVNFQQQPYQ